MGGGAARPVGMMIAGAGRFERGPLQVMLEFDEQMVGIAFEELGVGLSRSCR